MEGDGPETVIEVAAVAGESKIRTTKDALKMLVSYVAKSAVATTLQAKSVSPPAPVFRGQSAPHKGSTSGLFCQSVNARRP